LSRYNIPEKIVEAWITEMGEELLRCRREPSSATRSSTGKA
jgi:hypothetical protein